MVAWVLRVFSAAATTLVLAGSACLFTASAAQAAACPTVAPGSGALTPAPAPGVDWSGCELTGADFANADISNANFSDSDLSMANLTDANTDGADFAGADLEDTNAFGAALHNSNFTNANLDFFEASDLTGSDLQGADISNANFSSAILTHVKSGNVTASQAPYLPPYWSLYRGYLLGPGTDFSGANLSNWDFSNDNLSGDDLSGTNLTGANLTNAVLDGANVQGAIFANVTWTGVESGSITGQPLSLPAHWMLVNGYLIGPQAGLVSADLTGADLANADLAGADLYLGSLNNANLTGADLKGADLDVVNLTGATWSNTVCPDGTNSDNDGGTCASNIDDQSPVAKPTISGVEGANGWYVSAVTVAWHWAAVNSAINPADCTASSASTGQGAPVTLTATCLNVLGAVGSAIENVNIDSTPPRVSVNGVSSHHVYALGHVPAPGCSTTDSLSGVGQDASVKVTSSGANGTGAFAATCSGAADKAGNKQVATVIAHYTVAYGFRGFASPPPGATLASSARTIAIRYRLADAAGKLIPGGQAAALAAAGKVRATLRGPAIRATTAKCSWHAASGYFQCSITRPSGAKTGKSHPYTITATENVGTGLVTAPAIGNAADPETIYFK